jgi:hypothetical protein
MKQIILAVCCALSLFLISASCDKTSPAVGENNEQPSENLTGSKMDIIIGDRTFTATLYDNTTVDKFKELLPMTVKMTELNGNEKYVDLSSSLPTNATNPRNIQNGDLMLYGSATLVLFYKSFSTSYSYTRLGKIDDASQLASALGSGNVTVTFRLRSE